MTIGSPSATAIRRTPLAVLALLTAFLVIYLPDLGHGFIKDDYAWIRISRVASAADVLHLFQLNTGFYRPLVSLLFALDYRIWDLNPSGYGFTNLALVLIDAVLVYRLAREFSLAPAAAVLAAAVWAFNFHAVNMALLWSSGRTALLMCLCALSAALAMLKGRTIVGGILCLAALLCKEEAVCLPMVFSVFAWLEHRTPAALIRLWPSWAALAIYLILRDQSGAFGPANAPDYYRFTFNPGEVSENVLEYLDRGATLAALVGIVLALASGMSRHVVFQNRRPILFGAVWFIGFYALTVFLPVRSDLYALAPSIGSALIAGSIAAVALELNPQRFRTVATTLLVLIVALVPVYWARNGRWVRAADLSARVMRDVQTGVQGRAPQAILLVDNPEAAVTLDQAFGALFPDAVRLVLGDAWTGEIRQPPVAAVEDPTIIFRLRGDRLLMQAAESPGG